MPVVRITVNHGRVAAQLDAMEDHLLKSSNIDPHSRSSLSLVDLIRDIGEELDLLKGYVPYVPDRPVRAHLRKAIEAISPLVEDARFMLAKRTPARKTRREAA